MRRAFAIVSALLIASTSTAAQQWDSTSVAAALLADTASRKLLLANLEAELQRGRYLIAAGTQLTNPGLNARPGMVPRVGSVTRPVIPTDAGTAVRLAAAIADPTEPIARGALGTMVRDEGRRLYAHFALASAFKSTADEMALIPMPAAEKIVAGINKWDVITSALSTTLAGLGGLAYVRDNGRDAAGWLSLSAIVNVVQPLLSGAQGDNISKSANAALSATTEKLRERAGAVAIHSILTLQLRQKFAGLTSIVDRSKELSELPDPTQMTRQAAIDAANSYSILLGDIGRFYDTDLLGMAQALEDQATNAFFTQDSKAKMTKLAAEMRSAIKAWHTVHALYRGTQNAAEQYVTDYGK